MKNHIELNNDDSSYTANATYYFGKAHWNEKDENFKDAFLSISDCRNTIKLHPNVREFDNAEMKRFKEKLSKLKNFIEEFIEKLPNEIEKIY